VTIASAELALPPHLKKTGVICAAQRNIDTPE